MSLFWRGFWDSSETNGRWLHTEMGFPTTVYARGWWEWGKSEIVSKKNLHLISPASTGKSPHRAFVFLTLFSFAFTMSRLLYAFSVVTTYIELDFISLYWNLLWLNSLAKKWLCSYSVKDRKITKYQRGENSKLDLVLQLQICNIW